jgi:hypothetical protein
MQVVNPAVEIENIKSVLSNFSWKLVKQVITDQEITLTITKALLALPDEQDPVID